MRLKTFLFLMLSAMLLAVLPPVLAEESDVLSPLSLDEIIDLTRQVTQLAQVSEPILSPASEADLTEEGYAFVYDFGTLYLNHPVMDEGSMLLSYVITSEDVPGCRHTGVGQPLYDLLGSFTSENPQLDGDYNHAVLYLYDDLPEGVSWAWLARDGQRPLSVQYSLHMPAEDGTFTDVGLLYTLQAGFVDSIRVFGLTSRITAQELRDTLLYVQRSAMDTGYTAVPSSFNGLSLTPFSERDLVFSGLDFLHATPEQVTRLLGTPLEDNQMEDSDGTTLRMMDFGTCEIFFRYDESHANPVIESVTISQDGFEGPRAVRVGDTFSSVLCRFRFGEGEYQDGFEVLYGSTEIDDYATCEYGDDASAVLRYFTCTQDGVSVEMMGIFNQMELTELLILRTKTI